MEPQSKVDGEESPRLCHLELYDSTEDLEDFAEPFRRRDLAVEEMNNPKQSFATRNTEIKQPVKDDDMYCLTCCVPITALDKEPDEHQEHEVIPFLSVVEIAREELQRNIRKLEKQICHLQGFSSHLEEIFITVEENFARQEQNFERRYEDILQTLEQRYEEKMQALGEEKKKKLEALYEQLVSCGENLDTCKDLMETIEALGQKGSKADAIKTAVATTHRLETFLEKDIDVDISTPADFEDRVIDFSEIQELMDAVNSLPAPLPPSSPAMNPQEPNSATGTSVRVCWSFFSEDIVESYQLCYKLISNDTSKKEETELGLNVKETYCTVKNLTPNTQYELWVKALNRAGVSLASERAVYMTAPLPPVIKSKEIQSCEHAALVRWECGNTNPVDSYTVELAKLTDGGDENVINDIIDTVSVDLARLWRMVDDRGACCAVVHGVAKGHTQRSIIGIPNCETLIQLEPHQDYLISVRALNMGGQSERSKPFSILSTGTSFTLKRETAHPWLTVLEDGLTITCSKTESPRNDLPCCENSFTRSVAILGHPILFRGKHYWEVDVDENIEYCVGVAFENIPRDACLGSSHSAWCMRHTVAPSRHTYEFLNNGSTPDIRITVPPKRIGLLLDYSRGILSFFNTEIMQHLYTFHTFFWDFVCPCFAVEEPGTLRIRNGITIPMYADLL